MRLQLLVLTILAVVASGVVHAQVMPRNSVVSPRLLTSDTPRFHKFTIDDSVATCSKIKQRKRPVRLTKDERTACLQHD